MDNPDLISLRQILTGWIRWYRLRRAFAWSGTGLIAGASLALVGGFYSVSQGWLIRSEFYLGIVSAALIFTLAAALIGYLWPTPPHTAARIFDRTFDLDERLSTALELAPLSSSKSSIPELISLQLSDTLQHVRMINPRRFLPLYVRKINGTIMLLLTIVTILISWRGTPWFTAAAGQHQVEQAITNQIEHIQALHSNIQNNNHLTPQGQQELLQILDQTTRRLELADTPEEALSILSEAQQALRERSNPQTQSLSQALRSIGTSLSQQANSPLAPVGQFRTQALQ